MTIKECFSKKEYFSLFEQQFEDWEDNDFFNDDSNSLKDIYVSKCCDEMFLILEWTQSDGSIKDFCNKWDKNIMSFFNFGELPKNIKCNEKNKNAIRYNTIQIVLYNNENIDGYIDNIKKSTSISRKIFLKMSLGDEISDDNKNMLPFWYEEFKLKSIYDKTRKKSELPRMMPDKDKLGFIYEKKVSDINKDIYKKEIENNFNNIKEWLLQE